MNLGDLDGEPPVTDLRLAGDVLRPALRLWLLVIGLLGLNALLWAYLVPHLSQGSVLPLVVYEIVYAAMAVVIARFAWHDRAACRVFARPRRGMVELCLLVGIVGSMLLAMWERSITWSGSASPILLEHGAGWPIAATLLTSAVMPAVFEELMYRGVVLQRLRAVLSLPLALATQAMLFSVMHMDMVYVLPHFVFGCLAGLLRTAARALWPCMLMHFLWNGWLVLEQYEWL